MWLDIYVVDTFSCCTVDTFLFCSNMERKASASFFGGGFMLGQEIQEYLVSANADVSDLMSAEEFQMRKVTDK